MKTRTRVGFEKLEERVLPSGAGIIASSESLSRLLAHVDAGAILAIGSYSAWTPTPGLTTLGALGLGAGLAYAGGKTSKKSDKDKGEE